MTEENIAKWKEAYTRILEACEPYTDDFCERFDVFQDIKGMIDSAKNHLLLFDWYEKYGLELDHISTIYFAKYLRVSDYVSFIYFDDAQKEKDAGCGRCISRSDDGRQPKDEWLLCIRFSSGAYIFGDDYESQEDIFDKLITELKTYAPDYSDTLNKSFYWKLENAKPIYESFSSLLDKYNKLNADDLNRRRAKRLREELETLLEKTEG